MIPRGWSAGILVWALTAAAAQTPPPAVKPEGEPDRIVVQHVLISFKGSAMTDPSITRTKAEAEKLAGEVLGRARKGETFGDLVKAYSDDRYPGTYKMANTGVEAVTSPPSKAETPRAKFVKAFGDVSFKLAVGEVGLAVFDPQTSKYGWHVIKRLE